MRVYDSQERYVVIDADTRNPVTWNVRWHLASGGGYYAMCVLWPYGGHERSKHWRLSLN